MDALVKCICSELLHRIHLQGTFTYIVNSLHLALAPLLEIGDPQIFQMDVAII